VGTLAAAKARGGEGGNFFRCAWEVLRWWNNPAIACISLFAAFTTPVGQQPLSAISFFSTPGGSVHGALLAAGSVSLEAPCQGLR